ncbi:MAG: EutN/CcmL family microcompartment protein [Deltaproteobacteria bacterium]|nr:EutN/CcmL family microcompartment protein [Deltaproteobacteria bacterium]
MLLARVVGTVVSTQKEQSLDGLKFLRLRDVDIEGKLVSASVVAAAAVGAGVGGDGDRRPVGGGRRRQVQEERGLTRPGR